MTPTPTRSPDASGGATPPPDEARALTHEHKPLQEDGNPRSKWRMCIHCERSYPLDDTTECPVRLRAALASRDRELVGLRREVFEGLGEIGRLRAALDSGAAAGEDST